jgi:hypothetical protein
MEVSGLPLATLKTFSLAKGGTELITVPAGHRYYLAFASFQYVANATAATRIATIYIDHGTPETHLFKGTWTASQSLRANIGIANPAYASYLSEGTNLLQPLPLAAGDVFQISVSAGEAADTWSCFVRMWDVVVGT